MQIRKIDEKDRLAADILQSMAFLAPINVEEAKKKLEAPPTRPENKWGGYTDDGKLVSVVGDTQYEIYYDGHVVGMGGIGGVASAPESRMKGGVRSIMEALLRDGRERGLLFSVLYPFSHTYYRQFGYELCHEQQQLVFPVAALKGFRQTGTARLVLPGDDDAGFRRVYAQFATRLNYAVARTDATWPMMLRGDPYKAESYRYILSSGGEDTAYCMFQPRRESNDDSLTMILTDYAYADKAALYDLFGFLFKLGAQFTRIYIEVPSDFALSALIAEPYDVKQYNVLRTMARVLNVETALKLMRHPNGEGQYSVFVEDSFLPENTGGYAVRYGANGAKVEKTDANACDVSMTVQTFTQLCLGYMTFDMATLKADVTVQANEDTLRRVFVRKPMYLSDRF